MHFGPEKYSMEYLYTVDSFDLSSRPRLKNNPSVRIFVTYPGEIAYKM